MKTVHRIAAFAMVGTLAFAAQTSTAKASETPIAGIDVLLSDFYINPVNADLGLKSLEVFQKEDKKFDLAFAKVDNYVNIRDKASESGKIIGKLYKDNAATILSEENGWIKIKSGKVTGYIKADFLLTGDKAEEFAKTAGTLTATVTTTTLKVREKAAADATVLTLIPLGNTYTVTKEQEEWVKIKIDNSTSGYVSKGYVELKRVYDEAVSMEEERAREEQQTISSLSTSSSGSSKKSTSTSSSYTKKSATKASNLSTSSSSQKSSSSSESGSSLRNSIVSYALQFEGNPYRWGGTSLTNGADCSGFTQSVFAHFGISIPRTSRSQAASGTKVSIDEVRPGDLIFYRKNGTINHVALYIGNGKVISAKSKSEGIRITNMNYRTPYKAVRYTS